MILILMKVWNFMLVAQEAKVERWIAEGNYPRYF